MNAPDRDAPLPRSSLLGVLLIGSVALIRVSTTFDPFPSWANDPFAMLTPIVGITPAVSVLLDALTLLGTGLLLFSGASIFALARVLTIAAALVAMRFWLMPAWHGTPDDAVLGSTWLTSLLAAAAIHDADPRARAVVRASLYAILPLLAAKGVVQVFSEHPAMVQEFRVNKQQILASNGWTPGSPMALAYERRLSQAEASGWFGFANVYASLAAAGLVAFTCISLAAFRARSDRMHLVVAIVAALLSAIGLVLAGAKGGLAAALLGLVILGVPSLLSRLRTPRGIGGIISLACVASALSAVCLRGLVGERLHELSLLFRWFYLQAATRIASLHPLTGVGPAGFKDAYLLAKNPLSPEDVASPHSILFDYLADFGLTGAALCLVFLTFVWSAGKSLAPPASASQPSQPGPVRLCLLIGAIAIIVSAWFEQPLATVDSTILRLAGLAAYAILAQSLLSSGLPDCRVPVAAAALALAAHAQIELTAVTPGAVLWFMLAIASANPQTPLRRRSPAPAVLTLSLIAAIPVLSIAGWERSLRDAARPAESCAEATARANLLFTRPAEAAPDTPTLLARDLSAQLGRSVPADPQSIAAAINDLRNAATQHALPLLQAATAAQPEHFATSRALSRLCLQLAEMSPDPSARSRSLDTGLAVARTSAGASRDTAAAAAWLATALEAAQHIDPTRADPSAVADALSRAASLAPHEPLYQVRLASLLRHTRPKDAAQWARRALESDSNLRLDPIRRLTDAQRAEMHAIAGDG